MQTKVHTVFKTKTKVSGSWEKTLIKVQFSLQLADTVGAKKSFLLIRGVRFSESWARLVLFSKFCYFYTYTVREVVKLVTLDKEK